MKSTECPYQLLTLNSRQLEVPRDAYQRKLNPTKVKNIVNDFDERIANEPKVSCRNGHYYVFDGQHTIAARVSRNKNRDLPIRCRVYYGLSKEDEALLFARQSGSSSPLMAGAKLRAMVCGGDPEAIAFVQATESAGLMIDYDQQKGTGRIACVATALDQFRKVGAEHYKEGLRLIVAAWKGDADSLRGETLRGVIQFVDLYHGEYDPQRLVRRLRRVDPLAIYRDGRASCSNLPGSKKYLFQVLKIYNGGSRQTALPIKF